VVSKFFAFFWLFSLLVLGIPKSDQKKIKWHNNIVERNIFSTIAGK